MKNTDPFVPTRRGMRPRKKIELWHLALGLAVVLALAGLGMTRWIDFPR
jgi:hypothetical protein